MLIVSVKSLTKCKTKAPHQTWKERWRDLDRTLLPCQIFKVQKYDMIPKVYINIYSHLAFKICIYIFFSKSIYF